MIDVCITVDTEFSIAGAFTRPGQWEPIAEPNVTCPADGREQGLGFLLDTFADYGVEATFFVETLQSCRFGDAPMGRMVARILAARQDVQLHLHPCWLLFRDPAWALNLVDDRPNDGCDGRSDSALDDIIGTGLAALRRLGAPAPVALRTGSLRVDKAVYRAMRRVGLRIGSNVGLAAFRPQDPELVCAGGRRWVEGVLEVPVLTYRQPQIGGSALRLLAITASSWRETEGLLWRARAAGVKTCVILTHPFEFIKGDRMRPETWTTNRINQTRLRRLCAFIANHSQHFRTTSFAAGAPRWLTEGEEAAPDLAAPAAAALLRMVENKANDLIRHL